MWHFLHVHNVSLPIYCCQFAIACDPQLFHSLLWRNEPGKLRHSRLAAQHCHSDLSRFSVEGLLTLLAAQQQSSKAAKNVVDQSSVTERICIAAPNQSAA